MNEDVNSCRQLCKSMVILAVQDCFRDKNYAHNRRLIHKAKEWIMSNSDAPFSFIYCVENGIDTTDAEALVKRIRQIITEEQDDEIWHRLLGGSNLSKHIVVKPQGRLGGGLLC